MVEPAEIREIANQVRASRLELESAISKQRSPEPTAVKELVGSGSTRTKRSIVERLREWWADRRARREMNALHRAIDSGASLTELAEASMEYENIAARGEQR